MNRLGPVPGVDIPANVRSMVDLLKLPQRAFEGANETYVQGGDPQAGVGPAMDAAMMTAGTSAPFAETGAAGIFGGKLARGADLKKLNEAKQMEGAAQHPHDIWQATGWARGTDGHWKFEIPDNSLKLASGSEGKAKIYPGIGDTSIGLSNPVISHPALIDHYPQLNNLETGLIVSPDQQRMGMSTTTGDKKIFVQGPDLKTAKKTAAHELQHQVQNIEGFSQGGSPDYFLPIARQQGYKGKEASAAAYGTYRSLAGETEARNTAHRVDFAPNMRSTFHPEVTEDLLRKDQLVPSEELQRLLKILNAGSAK